MNIMRIDITFCICVISSHHYYYFLSFVFMNISEALVLHLYKTMVLSSRITQEYKCNNKESKLCIFLFVRHVKMMPSKMYVLQK